MLHLTYNQIVQAAKEHYLAGTLSAQSESPICEYRNRLGNPCAVGAAIPDDLAQSLIEEGHNDEDVEGLSDRGLIEFDDIDAVLKLQQVHDAWANAQTNPSGSASMMDGLEVILVTADEAEAKFRTLLGLE